MCLMDGWRNSEKDGGGGGVYLLALLGKMGWFGMAASGKWQLEVRKGRECGLFLGSDT